MISEELLSLVLGYRVLKIDNIEANEMTYTVKDYFDIDGQLDLNLDTLGRLCKEWISNQSYMIWTYEHEDTVAINLRDNESKKVYSSPSMSVFTELEAIIKATEFVALEKGLLSV